MDRRRFLGLSAATAGGWWIAGCAPADPSYPPQSGAPFEGEGTFPSGIGSADPLPDAVLLWTRVHPDLDRGDGVPVDVEVATSPTFAATSVVATSTAVARADRDHVVVLDATSLLPGTTYWYRFRCGGALSRLGRTRTAPAPGAEVDRARIASFSCQRWTHGWFNSHADLAAMAEDPDTDVDVVLCLGDYVYNSGYADGVYVAGRDDPIQDARTRLDFWSKYRLYRSDPDLQAMHAAYPVVQVFDNHDGLDQPGDPMAPGAIAAFFDHVALRSTAPGRIHRSFAWGDLAQVFLTDQRQFRDATLPEAGPLGTSTSSLPAILDPRRTMLGAEQRQWLLDGLATSSAAWKVIGSQLMFWPWRTVGGLPGQPRGSGTYLNMTQWDGYVAERLALLDRLATDDVRDVLLFSGDSHVFSAAQVAPDVDDAASLPRVLEFGTGSVTSNNADENDYPSDDVTGPLLRLANPNHLRWFESERHGYVIATLDRAGADVEVRSSPNIHRRGVPSETIAAFHVGRGTQRIRRTA